MEPSTCSRPCTPRASLSWARQYSYALLRKNVTINVVIVACCCQKVCDTEGGAQRASPCRRACVGVPARAAVSRLSSVGSGSGSGSGSG
jgi:hypothetical protein